MGGNKQRVRGQSSWTTLTPPPPSIRRPALTRDGNIAAALICTPDIALWGRALHEGSTRPLYRSPSLPPWVTKGARMGHPFHHLLPPISGSSVRIPMTLTVEKENKLAILKATLVQNYDTPTDRLTGVKCRATSVAKKYDIGMEKIS